MKMVTLMRLSFAMNIILGGLTYLLVFGPLSFQALDVFKIIASGRDFGDIVQHLDNVHERNPIFKQCDDGDNERMMHTVEQSCPASNRAYRCYVRFPPGYFLVHVDKMGYIEHIRFYSSDGGF